MSSVWTVTTRYENGRETLNCICETEDKAKNEKKMLDTMAKENKEYIESTCSKGGNYATVKRKLKVSSIYITEWFVL
jgi:hypothetical protein